jgi:hypothetical protein
MSSPPKKESLKEFIEGNDRLLTAFGVFATLTAVFFELHHPYLTLVGYGLVVLILWEVMSDKSKAPPSLTLNLFALGLISIIAGLTFHLLMGVGEIPAVLFRAAVGIVTAAAVVVAGEKLLRKLGVVKLVTSRISSGHIIAALQLITILLVMGLVIVAVSYLFGLNLMMSI